MIMWVCEAISYTEEKCIFGELLNLFKDVYAFIGAQQYCNSLSDSAVMRNGKQESYYVHILLAKSTYC